MTRRVKLLTGGGELRDASAFLAPSKSRRTILTEDSFRGRYTEFAIGDSKRRLKPSGYPANYVSEKTFDPFGGLVVGPGEFQPRMFQRRTAAPANPGVKAELATYAEAAMAECTGTSAKWTP